MYTKTTNSPQKGSISIHMTYKHLATLRSCPLSNSELLCPYCIVLTLTVLLLAKECCVNECRKNDQLGLKGKDIKYFYEVQLKGYTVNETV